MVIGVIEEKKEKTEKEVRVDMMGKMGQLDRKVQPVLQAAEMVLQALQGLLVRQGLRALLERPVPRGSRGSRDYRACPVTS